MVTAKKQTKPIISPKKTIDNNNVVETSSINNISTFYDGAVVFLTGGTGFLGKALIEKLLRSCPGIDTIFTLIRPKRGQSIEQRLKELLKNSVFDRIKEKTPEYLQKIKVIAGDVTQPNLGLSETDRNLLINTVTIAFHSAATVRFNEPLKEALNMNTIGTQRMIKLCNEIKQLKSFVHVSTAYSNADKQHVDEIVYKPVYDPDSIIKCVETLPPEMINILSEKIRGKQPNTYTLTKNMAEFIVEQNRSVGYPTAIVRPSIVTAAWKEPMEGWIDNITGVTGIIMEIGRGTIRSLVAEDSHMIDCIPVDVVVQTLITAAWHNATQRVNELRVYNCTSGQINGITWKDFGDLTLKYAQEYPSKYTIWNPGFTFRTNRLIHYLCHCLLHVLPAAFLDVLLYLTKHKPIMLRICNKFSQAIKVGTFFALHEWTFENKTLKQLIDAVKAAEDGHDFSLCDISVGNSKFSWENYVKNYILGIRKYVLKDDESTLETARNKIKRLSWTKKILQLISLAMFIKMFYL